MKNIFDFIVSFWNTTEIAIVNWIIIGLMAPMAYVSAYNITGESAFILGFNSKAMGVFHWVIRFLIYIGATYIIKGLIWVVAQVVSLFNTEYPNLIASIIVAVILVVLAVFVKIKSGLKHRFFWK